MASARKRLKVTAETESPASSRRPSTSAGSESKREQGNLYDAVAGRLTHDGFICDNERFQGQPAKPEEVLFRRKYAPERTEEHDEYFANRDLPEAVRLPGSDLLKVLHAYTSDYYAALNADDRNEDFKSFDETALIALGILLEEAARASLGNSGELALVEAAEEERRPA